MMTSSCVISTWFDSSDPPDWNLGTGCLGQNRGHKVSTKVSTATWDFQSPVAAAPACQIPVWQGPLAQCEPLKPAVFIAHGEPQTPAASQQTLLKLASSKSIFLLKTLFDVQFRANNVGCPSRVSGSRTTIWHLSVHLPQRLILDKQWLNCFSPRKEISCCPRCPINLTPAFPRGDQRPPGKDQMTESVKTATNNVS